MDDDLLPAYAEWLARLTATHDAVAYTCRVRLGDAAAGEAVALHVVRGLVMRPAVFRHWGLPFSGRIAKLAEDAIAGVPSGRPVTTGAVSWVAFRAALRGLPADEQSTFVLTCVDGHTDEQLAEHRGCDVALAGAQRAAVLARMRDLAAGVGSEVTDRR